MLFSCAGGKSHAFVSLVDYFCFENLIFIASHHMLHSPTSLVLLSIVFCCHCRRNSAPSTGKGSFYAEQPFMLQLTCLPTQKMVY